MPTRIRKLNDGEYDAIVLAAAGVKRLGLESNITAYLSLDRVLPAVAQGAIGVQTRQDDEVVLGWIRQLDDVDTRQATTSERSLLHRLEGGCQVPVGALARVEDGRADLARDRRLSRRVTGRGRSTVGSRAAV